jgi:DNA-binding transcriptional regulator YiaG
MKCSDLLHTIFLRKLFDSRNFCERRDLALKTLLQSDRPGSFTSSKKKTIHEAHKAKQAYLPPVMTGSELKNFRKALGLSQRSFGQIIRVSRATIARAERMQKLTRIVSLSLDQALRDGKIRMKTKPNELR